MENNPYKSPKIVEPELAPLWCRVVSLPLFVIGAYGLLVGVFKFWEPIAAGVPHLVWIPILAFIIGAALIWAGVWLRRRRN